MKSIFLLLFLAAYSFSSEVMYECSNTILTKNGKTSETFKKPTIIVETNWMKKPILVKVYLRDRGKEVYNRIQFSGINKQSIQEWMQGPTIFYGEKNSTLKIFDKGSYYLVKTHINDTLFAENECVKK